MPELFCVRAEGGKYAKAFLEGGYVAIGWFPGYDLSSFNSREDIVKLYRDTYPNEKSNYVIGTQAGQVHRFLNDIHAGDYIITPSEDVELLYWGIVVDEPCYDYMPIGDRNCPYCHRRKVNWAQKPINRSELSIPFQNTMRATLTVFAIAQSDEFFRLIGRPEFASELPAASFDYYNEVIERVLRLDATEFEYLVLGILQSMGFEGEHKGKVGDGGVDVVGVLDVSNLVRIKLYVQAKRFKQGAKVAHKHVLELRKNIPNDCQGAFITTAEFNSKAREAAIERGFPRIGLIDGRQLVDLLVKYWQDIDMEFRQKLELKPALVPM